LAPRAGAVNGHVVIELETGKFQSEYAGKLNFYVALVGGVLAGVGELPDTLYPARA
jgi:hypothetical protein